jgi:hypothetical protein
MVRIIYKLMSDIGETDKLKKIHPAKDWSKSLDGGSRTIIREDHRI